MKFIDLAVYLHDFELMKGKIKYDFSAAVWKYTGAGGWFFVTLPIEISDEIRTNLKWQEEGWGRLQAKATIGNSGWDTAIWYDTKHKAYLLPIKAEIRKKEKIELDKEIKVTVWV